jgi:hypothetical protein
MAANTKEKSYDVVGFINKYFTPMDDEKLWVMIVNQNVRNLKQLASLIKSYNHVDDPEYDNILGCTTYGICVEYLGYRLDRMTLNYLRERGGNWNWGVKPGINVRKVFESLKQYEKTGKLPEKVEYKKIMDRTTQPGKIYVTIHPGVQIATNSAWNKPLVFKK